MSRLLLGLKFYLGNARSFSRLGFRRRGLHREPVTGDFGGQRWLVTGASGGIGRAVVEGAVARGAEVVAVARDPGRLESLGGTVSHPERVETVAADLALVREVHALLDTLAEDGRRIDVLVNNVGVLRPRHGLSAEGVERAFAVNLLNHLVLTEGLLERGLLGTGGLVVEVSSGGMYTAPLDLAALEDRDGSAHDGVADYARHKRAQLALVHRWQSAHGARRIAFHAMHPGWVDTAGLRDSLPGFRQLFGPILRSAEEGADTILWLAATRPPPATEGIWFDRALRAEHVAAATRSDPATEAALPDLLRRRAAEALAAAGAAS